MGHSWSSGSISSCDLIAKYEKLFTTRRKIYKTVLKEVPILILVVAFILIVQTKISKYLTLDNETDYGDLPFHAAHAITVDGCIRLMQTKAAH